MKTLFVITSVIEPWTNESFFFDANRSLFRPEERYLQTIETIQSIRRFSPNSDIWMVEAGKSIDIKQFQEYGIKVIYIGKYHLVRKFVSKKSKALGEVCIMMCIFWRLFFSKYDLFYKMSGRYILNNSFDKDRWSIRNISGKDIYNDKKHISTRLIGIPHKKLLLFYSALLRRFWRLNKDVVYESYLVKGLGLNNIEWIDNIGVEGKCGAYDIYYKE